MTNYFGKLGFEDNEGEVWKDNINEIVETLKDLKTAGKIRHFGLSNETPWGVMRYFVESEKTNFEHPVSIQNPYSLLNRTFEVGLSEITIREKCGLLAYSPLAFGLLSGKYHDGSDVSTSRITLFPKLGRYNDPNVVMVAKKYFEIAKKYGLSPTQLSLAYVNTRKFVTANIIGATTMSQLKENIKSIDVRLSDEMISEINKVHAQHSNPAP